MAVRTLIAVFVTIACSDAAAKCVETAEAEQNRQRLTESVVEFSEEKVVPGQSGETIAWKEIGWGVLINNEGDFVTANHVLGDAGSSVLSREIKATFLDGSELILNRDSQLFSDRKNDLVVVSTAQRTPRTGAVLSKSVWLDVKDSVVYYNAAMADFRPSNVRTDSSTDFLEIDTKFERGLSGSPIADCNGFVVGVLSSSSSGPQDYALIARSDPLLSILVKNEIEFHSPDYHGHLHYARALRELEMELDSLVSTYRSAISVLLDQIHGIKKDVEWSIPQIYEASSFKGSGTPEDALVLVLEYKKRLDSQYTYSEADVFACFVLRDQAPADVCQKPNHVLENDPVPFTGTKLIIAIADLQNKANARLGRLTDTYWPTYKEQLGPEDVSRIYLSFKPVGDPAFLDEDGVNDLDLRRAYSRDSIVIEYDYDPNAPEVSVPETPPA